MFNIDNIDFSKSQRVFIWGNPGCGKTLLLTDIVSRAMMSTINFVDDVYEEIDYLNRFCGFNLNKNFEHLVFSNFEVTSDYLEIPDLKSYRLNPYKIGLFGKFDTDIFPYGTNFSITEAQNYWPSEMNEYIRPEVIRYLQTSRHADISFFIDAQRPFDVAKKIRDLFDVFIECISVDEIIRDDFVVGHSWNLRIIDNPRTLEQYLKNNDKSLCRSIKYSRNCCLYFNYDSKFCRDLHLKGKENKDFKIEYFSEGADNDVLSTPTGYFIKKIERTNNEMNDEVIF